jgi:hypothetical protein
MISHKASIYLLSGKVEDGTLLSVRDSSVELEVPPIVRTDTTISGYRLKIPFSEVNLVLLRPDGVKGAMGGGFALGCIGGLAAGCGLSVPKKEDWFSGIEQMGYTILGGAAGAGIGALTAGFIQLESNKYYLYKAKDLEYLKTVAIEK